ncbi:MAG: cupin domain-containing protein [Chloroflexi bacterium]|nr:cupin domain-containing protein [Chloroflexota bacterium]
MSDERAVNVGETIHRLRVARNISMRSLANASGLSANAISMIERGAASPSVSTLYKLADALGAPVTAFFGTPESPRQVIFLKANGRSRVPIPRGIWEGLGGEQFVGRVEPFVLTLDTGADSGSHAMVHTGHEFVFCLQGKVEYEVEGQPFLLTPGDSLLFAAHLEHQWRNAGSMEANLLILLSGFDDGDRPLAVHLKKHNP